MFPEKGTAYAKHGEMRASGEGRGSGGGLQVAPQGSGSGDQGLGKQLGLSTWALRPH